MPAGFDKRSRTGHAAAMKFAAFLFAVVASSLAFPHGSAAEAPEKILVITSDSLKPAFEEFARWKTRLGRPTEVVSVTEIALPYSSKKSKLDLQEQIRIFVIEKIEADNVRWVVLGGDSDPNDGGHVPDRDTFHLTMWGENKAIPTDIYYLSRGNWDADSDGIFGEYEDDREAIHYPDGSVAIGRLPVRTPEDVKAYLEKAISYETNYPAGDFAKRMIYTCAVPQAEAKLHTSWQKNVSQTWPEGNGEMFFNGRSPWDKTQSGDHALSPKNLIELINRKLIGKFHFHGHGLNHCWVLEDHDELNLSKLSQLQNDGAYPIITTVSCFTGQFDGKDDPCISEAMLRLPDAGAIAILAPSREGKPHFTDPQRDFPLMMKEGKMDGTTETMTRFWQHGVEAPTTIGEAYTAMKADLAERAASHPNFHMCICELNLLGDPSLQIHAAPPRTLDPIFPDSLSSGKSKLVLSGLAAGALVTVSDGEQIFFRGEASRAGKVVEQISIPDDKSDLSIGVRLDGYNSVVKRCPIADAAK